MSSFSVPQIASLRKAFSEDQLDSYAVLVTWLNYAALLPRRHSGCFWLLLEGGLRLALKLGCEAQTTPTS